MDNNYFYRNTLKTLEDNIILYIYTLINSNYHKTSPLSFIGQTAVDEQKHKCVSEYIPLFPQLGKISTVVPLS